VLPGSPPFSFAEHFGDPAAEYRAVREASGILDRTDRGLLAIRGKGGAPVPPVADFLERLLSSRVRDLQVGRGQPSCLLTPKGKVTAAFLIFRTAPAEYLLHFAEPRRAEAEAVLSKYALLEGLDLVPEDGVRKILSVQARGRRRSWSGRSGSPDLPASPSGGSS